MKVSIRVSKCVNINTQIDLCKILRQIFPFCRDCEVDAVSNGEGFFAPGKFLPGANPFVGILLLSLHLEHVLNVIQHDVHQSAQFAIIANTAG